MTEQDLITAIVYIAGICTGASITLVVMTSRQIARTTELCNQWKTSVREWQNIFIKALDNYDPLFAKNMKDRLNKLGANLP